MTQLYDNGLAVAALAIRGLENILTVNSEKAIAMAISVPLAERAVISTLPGWMVSHWVVSDIGVTPLLWQLLVSSLQQPQSGDNSWYGCEGQGWINGGCASSIKGR